MTTMNIKHFDKLAFVDEAKNAGADEKFARIIADKLEQVEAHKNEEFATKADLKDLELRLSDKIDRAVDKSTNKTITIISVVILIATFILKFH